MVGLGGLELATKPAIRKGSFSQKAGSTTESARRGRYTSLDTFTCMSLIGP